MQCGKEKARQWSDPQLCKAWASASHFVSRNPHFDEKQLVKAAIS